MNDWREELVRLRPYLFKIARKNLRGFWRDTDDVVQQAYVRMFVRGFDPSRGASLRTWAITCIKSMVWDHKREAYPESARHKANKVSARCIEIDNQPDESLDPRLKDNGEAFPAIELIESIKGITEGWGENYRAVFALHMIGGCSVAEVASALGLSQSRICQIRQTIREQVTREGVLGG